MTAESWASTRGCRPVRCGSMFEYGWHRLTQPRANCGTSLIGVTGTVRSPTLRVARSRPRWTSKQGRVKAGRVLHSAGRHGQALALSEFRSGPERGSIFRERAAELLWRAGSRAAPLRADASRAPAVARDGRCSPLTRA